MTESESKKHEVRVFPNNETLFHAAAEEFARLAEKSVKDTGAFFVALSGGSTPRGLYALLADPSEPYHARVPWDRVHVFWSDERWVPLDHADSNYRMAFDTLLSRAPIPADRIHPMPVGNPTPAETAEEYELTLSATFQTRPDEWPRFDLILLGMGADGHTASLFPGSSLLEERERKVGACHIPKLDADRMSMTFPLINSARRILLLATGAEKAEAVRSAIEGAAEEPGLPVQSIAPVQGRASWFLDEAASSSLSL